MILMKNKIEQMHLYSENRYKEKIYTDARGEQWIVVNSYDELIAEFGTEGWANYREYMNIMSGCWNGSLYSIPKKFNYVVLDDVELGDTNE